MIAAVYARKSTEQFGVDDDDKSVARQVEHGRAFAEQQGWVVDPRFIFTDDGVSGAAFDDDRPGLFRLLNSLKPRPSFQVLIMADSTRLGREQIPTMYALQQIIDAGVRVWFYLEKREATLEGPLEQMMQTMTAFASAMQRDQSRKHTRDAMLRKARAAHVTGGRCFGYDNLDVMSGRLDAAGRPHRSHVERQINDGHAAVIRRIFELCAAGSGKARIARKLNEEGAPAPRPQLQRPQGWTASTVGECLHRECYRGEIVWNKTITRRVRGKYRQVPQAASEWIRVPAPHLRIVPEALWQAAHARLAQSRAMYLRSTKGQLWGRPLNQMDAKYLLSGLAACGACGGTLEVRSRQHGRRRVQFYMCSTHRRRGAAICKGLDIPMAQADAAVLTEMEDRLLHPEALRRSMARVFAGEPVTPARSARRAELEERKTGIALQLQRLAAAIADGADHRTMRTAIQSRELELQLLERDIADMRQPDPAEMDPEAMRRTLEAMLPDWRGVLHKHPAQARSMIRKLLKDRLVFTPEARNDQPGYRVRGVGTMAPLLNVVLKENSAQAMASPAGNSDLCTPLDAWFPRAFPVAA